MKVRLRKYRRALGLAVIAASVAAALVGSGVGEAARARPLASGPVNSTPPTIAGSLAVGQTLTASPGVWSGSGTIQFAYQWERCNSSGRACTALNAVSSKTLTIVSADVGHTLEVLVTAKDVNGSSTASSGTTGVVSSSLAAPRSTALPTIGLDAAAVGHRLTATQGSWSGTAPLTFSYQWQRCNVNGNACTALNAVSASTWTIQSQDVGHTVRVIVTAKNTAGSASAASQPTGVVTSGLQKPTNSTKPAISGKPAIGSTLETTKGMWGGTWPLTFSYQWQRCDTKGNGCAALNAVSSAQYKVTSADANHTIRVDVAAHNAAGTVHAVTAATGVVAAPAPPLPSGAIQLGGGVVSVPASSVVLPDRLVISGVGFQPAHLRTRAPFTATFKVTDTAGHVVRDALVLLIGLPYRRIQNVPERATGVDGSVTFQLVPTRLMPMRRGSALVMFVRARTPQGDVLAGASTRRLVQITVVR